MRCFVLCFCLFVVIVSNVVRHTRLSDFGLPKSAYLTVHTLIVELVYTLLSATDACLCSVPFANSLDVFVVALGILLSSSYYVLVHRDNALLNHIVHLPAGVVPIVVASTKSSEELSNRGFSLRVQTVIALVYASLYARYVDSFEKPPYDFLRRLKTPRIRFWTAGIAFGVLPILLLSHHLLIR